MFGNKILLATDLTEISRGAEKAAFALAQRLDAKLVILHVAPERVSLRVSTVPPELSDDDESKRRLEELGKEEIPDAERIYLKGWPAETIVNVGLDEAVDLIVVGTVGRTGIARAVLGSVAENVVRHSTCPVMLVKSAVPMPGI